MFSAIPQKNRVAATTYFDEHLSHNDYYTQGEVLAHDHGGHWIGIGAERLGLLPSEPVTREVRGRSLGLSRVDLRTAAFLHGSRW